MEDGPKSLEINILEFPESQDHIEYHRTVQMNKGKPH